MEALKIQQLLEELRETDSDNARVEVKKARGGLPSRLFETLSAFSNTGGGVLLLGVEESRNFLPIGVEHPAQIERELASLMSDRLSPPMRGLVETHRMSGASIVSVEVPAVPQSEQPCYYMGEGAYRGSYVRVADGNRRLTEYEVSLLIAGQGQPREDERPVEQAQTSDLSADLVDLYVKRLRENRPRLFANLTVEEMLLQIKVLVPSQNDASIVKPSVAGLLSLGTFPQSHFPQLGLSFVVYPTPVAGRPGPEGERFLDNVVLDGSVADLTEDILARLRLRMSRRSIVAGAGRRDIWEYPELALREVVVNALVHRDLSAGALGAQVQVEMYPDRLVVRNSGGLFGPVELDRLGQPGISSARNGLLLKLLEDVPTRSGGTVVENRGSGIPAMLEALRAAGMARPEFRDEIAFFEVTFPNAALLDEGTIAWLTGLGVSGLSDSQLFALARMRRGEVIKNSTYREELGIDSRQATAELRDLVSRRLAIVEGSGGGSTYALSAHIGGLLGPSRQAREDPVYQALVRGPLRRAEIDAKTGLPSHTVRRRLRALREQGLVEQLGPENSPTSMWQRTL